MYIDEVIVLPKTLTSRDHLVCKLRTPKPSQCAAFAAQHVMTIKCAHITPMGASCLFS